MGRMVENDGLKALLTGVAWSVAILTAGLGSAVQAKPLSDHLCAVDRPQVPVPAPLVTTPGQTARDADSDNGVAKPQPEPPVMTMGCVSRAHPLAKIALGDARTAVALVEAPKAVAAIYDFASPAERDGRIADWLGGTEPAGAPPGSPISFYIAAWQNSRWSFPGRRFVHAMFPENAASGQICLARVALDGRPEALAALNNWCMDRLGLWAD